MEDRPGLFDDTRVLSDTQSDEVVAYRPVSTLAVLGAVLALVSALALVSPWFVWLPLIAAVTCFAGARAVVADPESKTGLGIAKAGLVISLLLGGAVFARTQAQQYWHASSARPVAERFLECLAEGDTVSAYELTLPLADRRPSEEHAAIYYEADADAAKRLADFASSSAVSQMLELEKPLVLGPATAVGPATGRSVPVSWHLEMPGKGGAKARELKFRVDRPVKSSPAVPAAWRVTEFKLGSPVI